MQIFNCLTYTKLKHTNQTLKLCSLAFQSHNNIKETFSDNADEL